VVFKPSFSSSPWKDPFVIGVSISLGIFLAQAIWLWQFSIDDAAISWRYATHLAEGLGLRWNQVGAPVEGYSNFLWVILLAGIHACGVDVQLASKALGVLFGGANLILVGLLCRRLFPEVRHAWLPALLVAMTPEWTMWGMSGLEMSLFGFLVLVTLYALTNPGHPRTWLLSAGLCGIVLTRPEGIAVGIVMIAAWIVLPGATTWRQRLQDMLKPASAMLSLAVALTLWRVSYFGSPLPNTVYAKFQLSLPSWRPVRRWLLFAAPFLAAWIVIIRRMSAGAQRSVGYLAGILILAHSAMTLPTSPVMNFLHRYHVALMPLLMLPVPAVVELIGRRHRLIGGATVAALALWNAQGFPAVAERRGWESEWQTREHWVASELSGLPGSPLIALQDAGRIPYWTDLPSVDAWGLCDAQIAHEGFSPWTVIARKPQVYIVSVDSIVWGFVEPHLGMDKLMYQANGFGARYRLWRYCLGPGMKATDVYGYAILLDAEWAKAHGITIPERSEFWPGHGAWNRACAACP